MGIRRCLPGCIRCLGWGCCYQLGTHFKDRFVHPDLRELKFVIEGAPLGDGDVGLKEIYCILLEHHPAPEKLVMHWEMVPPKDMDPYDCLERSWEFVKGLQERAR